MHRVRTAFAAALAVSLMPLTAAAARDELVIGIGQFPEGFHPNLFSHVAQSLVMGMTRRPFTAYDPDWNLICMLCTALPSFANGTAREEPTLAGTPGLASDYTIPPRCRVGRRHADHDRRRHVHLGDRPHRGRRRRLDRALQPDGANRGPRRQALHRALGPPCLRFRGHQRFRGRAGAPRARRVRRAARVQAAHALRDRHDEPRPLLRPVPHHPGRARRHHRPREEPDLVGQRSPSSSASSSASSRTRRRWRPTCCPARSTTSPAKTASRWTRRSPSTSATATTTTSSTSLA